MANRHPRGEFQGLSPSCVTLEGLGNSLRAFSLPSTLPTSQVKLQRPHPKPSTLTVQGSSLQVLEGENISYSSSFLPLRSSCPSVPPATFPGGLTVQHPCVRLGPWPKNP